MTGTSLRARLANGGGQEEVSAGGRSLRNRPTSPYSANAQWSPDGRYLVHMEQSGPTGGGVWALPMTGEKKPFSVVSTAVSASEIFQLSPLSRRPLAGLQLH